MSARADAHRYRVRTRPEARIGLDVVGDVRNRVQYTVEWRTGVKDWVIYFTKDEEIVVGMRVETEYMIRRAEKKYLVVFVAVK